MSIHIGAGPIGWYEDDFAPFNNDIAREARLIALARAGFEGLELGPHSRREVACVRAALGRHGLAFLPNTHAITLAGDRVDDVFERLAGAIAATRALGAGVISVAEVTGAVFADRSMPLARKPRLAGSQWADFGAKLSELADRVKAAGLGLAYRPHMGTIVESGDDVERLMAASRADVGLVLDTGHLAWGGASPAAVARTHATRVALVHLTDIDGERAKSALGRRLSYLDAIDEGVFVEPGSGSAEVGEVIASLASFSGWIVVDADRAGLPGQVARLRTVVDAHQVAA